MITSYHGNEKGTAQKRQSPFLYLGLLPVLLVIALLLGSHWFLSAVRVYEPAFLLPLLNTFLFLAAGVISYIAMRIYLISGSPTILWIGSGVLTLAAGALAAGWLIIPCGPNVNVTIFNVGALLAATCHLGAVINNLGERPGEADLSRRKQKVALAYLAVAVVMALLVVVTVTGLMPPFFIQGQGPTIIRQNVAGWAIVLFVVSSLFTMNRFRRQRAAFLYWYSLALMLLAMAMLAFFLQPAVGSPLGWTGRSAYVLAALYFLISVSSGLREARTPGASPSQTIMELLEPGLHWQEILATVSDAVVSYDDRRKILLWNQAAARIFGYPETEAVGKDIELIMPDIKALDAAGLRGGITEIELARQNGSRFNAEFSVSSKSSALGVIATLVIRDVTARKRAEEAVTRAKEEWERTFDAVSDLIAILDNNHRLVRINRAMAEALGVRPQDVLGKFCYQYMHQTDCPAPGCPHNLLMQDGREHTAEFRVLGRDFLVTVSPLRGEGGKLLGSVHLAREITARKRTEEALRESEEHYRSLFDNMLDGFAYCKMHFEQNRPVDFTYLKVNGAFETLTGLKNVTGKQVSEVIPGIREADPELLEIYGRVALTGNPERFETYTESLGMWFSISVYSPQKEYFVAIFDVITARKRAEEDLQRSYQRLDLLAESASRLLESVESQRVVADICLKVMEFLDCAAFLNFLLDERQGRLHLNAYAGITEEEARRIEWLDYGVVVCGCAARDGCRIVAEDILNTVDALTELVKSYGIQAYACHPLLVEGRVLGTLSFGARSRTSFTVEELALMKAVADQVAMAMDRKRAEEALRRLNEELEQRVEERTAELQETVAQLEEEITDRQRAEKALVIERQRFYDVLEMLPAYIVLLTPDYHVPFANRYFVENFGESQGMRCFEYLFGRTEPCEICETYTVLKTNAPHRWEWTGPNGRTYDIYDFPFTDVDGSPLIMEMGIDITDRKQAEEVIKKLNEELEQRVKARTAELEFANRELESFSYSVSHDLKAPIRAIQGFSRILAAEYAAPLDEEGLRLLEVIVSNTQIMAKLIDDLLALSRLGRQQIRKFQVNLAALARQVFVQLQAQKPERELQLNLQALPPAWGDPALLQQVMMNLLDNAIKYTRAKRTVAIEVGGHTQGRETIYYVKDNGVGFDERYADKVFGVFQRLHGGQEYEGTGVGLAIVQRIIHRHGGRVWAEGRVGAGATFYFSLTKSEE